MLVSIATETLSSVTWDVLLGAEQRDGVKISHGVT